jgi:hypothetical protein
VLKKTITYTDYNGNEQSEEFHFHLSAEKLLELEATLPGGFEKHLERILESQDGAQILELFKRLITMSIGQVSEDGKRFLQTDDIRDAFTQTNAYTRLFLELGQDAETAAEFFNGIVPKDLAEQAEKMKAGGGDYVTRERSTTPRPEILGGPKKVISKADAEKMGRDELFQKMQQGYEIES